jgi:hypothetical protein
VSEPGKKKIAAAVTDELARLRAHPHADRFRARLDFEHAMEALNRSPEHALGTADGLGAEVHPDELEAERLLAAVRDDPTVPAADQWTARGLLATNADKAIECSREALRLQPFHPYAGPDVVAQGCEGAGKIAYLARASIACSR